MKKIAIIYGSTGGNTQDVAKRIATQLNDDEVKLFDVAKIKPEVFDEYPNLILGTSTTGIGDLQDDWDSYLPKLLKTNLEGKTVALFGLGDASSYSDSFVDSLGILYEAVKDKGCRLVGQVSTDGYQFDESKADLGGEFAGLVIDEDNEPEKTGSRIAGWVAAIAAQLQ
jgi:flavodoxin I